MAKAHKVGKRRRKRSKGRVWPGALTPSTKRQQKRWQRLIGQVESDSTLTDAERQRRFDEGYRAIFTTVHGTGPREST
jgi:hypothetical protein